MQGSVYNTTEKELLHMCLEKKCFMWGLKQFSHILNFLGEMILLDQIRCIFGRDSTETDE